MNVLGVQLLTQRGGADDVEKQDRHLLQRLPAIGVVAQACTSAVDRSLFRGLREPTALDNFAGPSLRRLKPAHPWLIEASSVAFAKPTALDNFASPSLRRLKPADPWLIEASSVAFASRLRWTTSQVPRFVGSSRPQRRPHLAQRGQRGVDHGVADQRALRFECSDGGFDLLQLGRHAGEDSAPHTLHTRNAQATHKQAALHVSC